METSEYYGGTYPDPDEPVIENSNFDKDAYDGYIADIYHELEVLGEL